MENVKLKTSMTRMAWTQYEEDCWKGSGLGETHHHRQPHGRFPLQKYYYSKPEVRK